jgi:hypothetical protein
MMPDDIIVLMSDDIIVRVGPLTAPAREIAATAMRRRLIFLPGIAPTA